MKVSLWRGAAVAGSLWLLAGCTSPTPAPAQSPRETQRQQVGYPYPFPGIAPADPDLAIAHYRQRLQQLPGNVGSKLDLAQAYLAKGHSSGDSSYLLEAQALLGPLAKGDLSPRQKRQWRLLKVQIAEASHQFAQAIQELQKLRQAHPQDPDVASLLANCYLEVGQLDQAFPLSEANYRRYPGAASALQLARVQRAQGQDQQARQLIAAGIRAEQPQENRLSARLRSLLAELEINCGRLSQAELLLQQALQALPAQPQTLEILAGLRRRQGRWQEAEALYLQVFGQERHPIQLRHVARARQAQGKPAQEQLLQAEQMLRKEIQQGQFGHARDLARVLLDLNQPQEALKWIEKEYQVRRDWQLLELKAIALHACGRSEAAQQALHQAIATGIRQPSLWQRAALWGTESPLKDPVSPPLGPPEYWKENLQELDPSFTPQNLD